MEPALSLREALTVGCERHCVLRGERLVEVPHYLKQPAKTMRALVRVQDEYSEEE